MRHGSADDVCHLICYVMIILPLLKTVALTLFCDFDLAKVEFTFKVAVVIMEASELVKKNSTHAKIKIRDKVLMLGLGFGCDEFTVSCDYSVLSNMCSCAVRTCIYSVHITCGFTV